MNKKIKTLTEQEVLEEIKKSGRDFYNLQTILTKFKQTEKICLAAVKQNGEVLECVKKKTKEICLAAVKSNGISIKYVADQTPEMGLIAIKENAWALEYVNYDLQTEEMCLIALDEKDRFYTYVKIVDNPDHKTTMHNLLTLKKKEDDKKELKKKVLSL